MTAPTPATLAEPMPSALAKAISNADQAMQLGSDYYRDVAVMWAQVAQAQEAYRTRRELRAITDELKRLRRALTAEVPDGQ